jgi:hypothetical protein
VSDVHEPRARARWDSGESVPGRGIVRLAVWSTALFAVASLVAAAWPDVFMPVSVPIALVFFAAGCGIFAWAYVLAIGRSRYDAVSMIGLFFLGEGVAPAAVSRPLRVVLAVQVVVALTAAAVRPFTALAFGVLVPTLGAALMALWGARHGRFPPRSGH